MDATVAPPPPKRHDVARREVVSWSLYDFASSAYNTLILTFIYGLYFTRAIGGNTDQATFAWTQAINLSAVIVALSMPVLGAIADYSGRKKRFLVFFAAQCVLFTTLMFFTGPGDLRLAFLLVVLATVGFEAANVFYNAFLPEIATPRTIGRVSGIGFFAGYIGGLISLAIGLGMVSSWLPETDNLNVRATVLLVAAWFVVFSLPMLLFVQERGGRRERPPEGYMRVGFGRLRNTFRHIRELREALKLLVARMIYNDGLATVIVMASIYAYNVLGMETEQVLMMGVLLNVAAGLGALLFGFVDDRIGGKRTLIITLVVLTVAGIIGVSTTSVAGFWVAAALIGFMMGPNQSASRTLLAKLVPEHKHAEAFGLFAFSGKLASIAGPFVYGIVTLATGNHRLAMSSIIAFFVIGLIVLLTVREREGMAAAERLTAELA
jgi:MFS transporter, UMF1 family